MGDREILETYLNSASKDTPETDIFPHGTKSLLSGVINPCVFTSTLIKMHGFNSKKFSIYTFYCTVQMSINYSSENTTKQIYRLSLNLLYNA